MIFYRMKVLYFNMIKAVFLIQIDSFWSTIDLDLFSQHKSMKIHYNNKKYQNMESF